MEADKPDKKVQQVVRNRIPGRIADEMKRYPPFSMLPTETVESLAAEAAVQVVVKEEAIWRQGDIPNGELLFLGRGRVEYYWRKEDQSELVDVRDVGDLLGLTALMEANPYQVTATAVEDCLLFGLEWKKISALLDQFDDAKHYVRRHLFWATRISGLVPVSTTAGISTPGGVQGRAKTILQAHLDSSRVLHARGAERLVVCSMRDSVGFAAEQMTQHNLRSILVVDANRHPIGVVTSEGLVEHVIVGGASTNIAVEAVMTSPVVTVAEGSSATAATLKMLRTRNAQVCITQNGTSRSPVLDLYSEKELMTEGGYHPAALIREIAAMDTLHHARALSDEVEKLAGLYLTSGVSAILVGQICAELYDTLVQRLLTMARNEMSAWGMKIPDVPWAWMSVGSDGRREQILRTDMDNALVFTSSGSKEKDKEIREGLLKLTRRVVEMMVDCGFSRCQGGVMAANPRWCLSDAEWKNEITLAKGSTSSDRILRAIILYDMRYVAGDAALVEPLRNLIYAHVGKNPWLMTRLAKLVVEASPPLNFLGKFVVQRKGGKEVEFDLKSRGLAPLRDAARLWALKYGLNQRYSTGSRWEELAAHVPQLKDLAPLAHEGFEHLMRTRVLNGIKRGDSGRFLDPATLTKLDRSRLANVFDVSRMVQKLITLDFRLDA